MYHEPLNLSSFDIEGLRKMRRLLMSQHVGEKNHVEKMRLSARIRSVNDELFTITKNPIYK